MSELVSNTDDVLVELRGGVATITLNRPERHNALSAAMLDGLALLVKQAAVSDHVGAVVLTGAGTAFCAGGDVKGFKERGGEGGRGAVVDPRRVAEQQEYQRQIIGGIYDFPKPVVAALPGAIAGAGLGLALATDLRIGCPRTLVASAFANVGLSGDYGSAWLLNQLVGPARARELMFFGDRVEADRCLQLGLVNQLVTADQLQTHAYNVASRLANGPRLALRYMKQNLVEASRLDLVSSMNNEVLRHQSCGVTDEHREAVTAFAEKRPPTYPAPWL